MEYEWRRNKTEWVHCVQLGVKHFSLIFGFCQFLPYVGFDDVIGVVTSWARFASIISVLGQPINVKTWKIRAGQKKENYYICECGQLWWGHSFQQIKVKWGNLGIIGWLLLGDREHLAIDTLYFMIVSKDEKSFMLVFTQLKMATDTSIPNLLCSFCAANHCWHW